MSVLFGKGDAGGLLGRLPPPRGVHFVFEHLPKERVPNPVETMLGHRITNAVLAQACKDMHGIITCPDKLKGLLCASVR